MRGWLVYSPEGYGINRWFADRLVASAKTEGLDLSLKIVTKNTLTLEALMNRIKACPGITKTSTNIILSSLKNNCSVAPHAD